MNQERSVKHHYIPQFLIKNWADGDGKFWAYNKREDRVFLTNSRGALNVNNLYTTVTLPEFDKSDEIEKQFVEQEGRVAPIIKRVINDLRHHPIARLTSLL